ncbi:dienelactone hydrolase family protein [Litorilinea aerophila]|uniref:Dienelactone hydrolase family protein n=1 Tax=Litorilinea aerophila TaxID=1204385 RepID=A0A540VA24_9CHLR|nr:dienelactone hydrolase family protein [Litorilinea aerophila]MCC9078558.1 dienelactone hydrolase family protein [Litorilinea aerophila]
MIRNIPMPMHTVESRRQSFQGYLALPPSGSGPGVLLLHAWWGLNPFIQELSDRLAQAGFVTFAPDYYDGAVATTIEDATRHRQALDRKATNRLVADAVDFLVDLPALTSSQIGVVGFSLGCGFAIEAARSRNQTVNAVVLYYGTGGGKFDKVQADFLGHFAAQDEWGAHGARAKALAERIQTAGRNALFHIYPETEHWFAEADRPEFDPEAAELAWDRTVQFLGQQLA